MSQPHDIRHRQDIETLLEAFYKQVMDDPQIGYLFTEVAQLDLEHHLPIIADFWETVLFSVRKYRGTPLEPHADLHRQAPLTQAHFDRWLTIWTTTVDRLFSGPVADLASQRARTIATVMMTHLERTPSP